MSGVIELVCDPVKVGQRLFIGETLLHTGDPARPFARSVCTFLNRHLDVARDRHSKFPSTDLGSPSYDESLQLREPVPGTFEMELHEVVRNGANGTVQGGAEGARWPSSRGVRPGPTRVSPGRRPRDPLPQQGAHRARARHR